MEQYALYGICFNVLSITKNLILQQIDMKDTEKRDEVEKTVKNFDLIIVNKQYTELLLQLLSLSFDTKLSNQNICKIDKNKDFDIYNVCISINDFRVDRNNYDYLRNQIIKVNNMHLPKQSKNAELQKWFDKARKHKERENNIDMEDIITSIMSIDGYTQEEMKNMTIYAVNKLVEKINNRDQFKANISYICAGAEKVKIEHWMTHKEEKEDNYSVSYDEFTKKFGNILNNKKEE
jgi:hypothetical protein